MRLDHLLSKEQSFHGSPVCPRVWDGGCSRVEHRLFGTDLVVAHKYKLVSFGGFGSGTWERSGAVPDTLLGPEGSGNTAGRA